MSQTLHLLTRSKPDRSRSVRRSRANDGAVHKGMAVSISTQQDGLERIRACPCGGGCPECSEQQELQTKYKISKPGDKYEQEADRVADQIMRMPDPQLQRQPIEEEEEEEELLQTKLYNTATTNSHAPIDSQISSLGPGQLLSFTERSFFEPRFGHDFSQVRIHTDSRAAGSAQAINARAYTMRQDIVFGTAQYVPQSAAGKKLLAHELTHVMQLQGRARLVQRSLLLCEADEECPAREPDEHSWARRYGLHAAYITSPEAGFLVWGIPINSADTTGLGRTSEWGPFWGDMMTRAALWRVRGFTDCQGDAALNTSLRQQRALNARYALPTYARRKVVAFFGAPFGECVAGNATKEERAFNRSALFQIMEERVDLEEELEVPGTPPARHTECSPNPHGPHLPPVGTAHKPPTPMLPCLLTEAQVRASRDWCLDSWQRHRGETCYREIPSSYCAPADQYCYTQDGCCHNSPDQTSPVDPSSPGGGRTCTKAWRCIPGHVWEDVL